MLKNYKLLLLYIIIDYTANLIVFCENYNIELIGQYCNVKKATPIYFKCGQCSTQVKKSFKNLTQYIDSPNVCIWTRYCHKCFYNIHH